MLNIDTQQSTLPVAVVSGGATQEEYAASLHANPQLLPMSDDMRTYIVLVLREISLFIFGRIEALWLRTVLHAHRYKLASIQLPRLLPESTDSESLSSLFASTWEASEFTKGVFWDPALLLSSFTLPDESLRALVMEMCSSFPNARTKVPGGRQNTHNGYKADPSLLGTLLWNGERHTLYWSPHPFSAHPEDDDISNMKGLPGLFDDVYPAHAPAANILERARLLRPDISRPVIGNDISSAPLIPGVRYLMAAPPSRNVTHGATSVLVAVEFDTTHKEWNPFSASLFLTTIGVMPGRLPDAVRERATAFALRIYRLFTNDAVVEDNRGAQILPKETHYTSLYWGTVRAGVDPVALGPVDPAHIGMDVRRAPPV